MDFNIVNLVNLFVLLGIIYLLHTVLKLSQQVTDLQNKLAQRPQSPQQENPIKDELIQLLNDGQYVKAVKRVRETMGLSLLEAKQYIDFLKLENNR